MALPPIVPYPPIKTQFFTKAGQIAEEWQRFFLQLRTSLNFVITTGDVTTGIQTLGAVGLEAIGQPLPDDFILPGPPSLPTSVVSSALLMLADADAPEETWPVAMPGLLFINEPIIAGTVGSVLFIGANGLAQDNGNFFWDDTNFRLGIKTASPNWSIEAVTASGSVGGFTNTGSAGGPTGGWFRGFNLGTTESGNFEEFRLGWSTNSVFFQMLAGGTGVARPMEWNVNGQTAFFIDSAGRTCFLAKTPDPNAFNNGINVFSLSGVVPASVEFTGNLADADATVQANLHWSAASNTGLATTEIAKIAVQTQGATANKRGGAMYFFTRINNGALTEAVRITNTQQVGINGAPDQALTITAGALSITNNASAFTAAASEIVIQAFNVFGAGATLLTRSDDLLFTSRSGGVNYLIIAATTGNFSMSGLVAKYNNIATVANGVPSEYAAIDTTGLTANVAAATLYTVPASGAGMYRISSYVVETTAGSVSSTLPNVQIVYTDNDTGTSITIDSTPILGIAGIGQTGALTSNTIGTASSGVIVVNAKASTTIQYQTVNYASNLAGMTYALHIKLEAL